MGTSLPQNERYHEIEQARQREKEREERNRARAMAKLTAAKMAAETEAEKQRERELAESMGIDVDAANEKELAAAMAGLGMKPVQTGRAPLQGMVESAPRVDVGDFAAKRAAALAKAKMLREEQGGIGVTVSMGARAPGIGSDAVGGDWGRYERGETRQSTASSKPVRSEPKRLIAPRGEERSTRTSPRTAKRQSAATAKAASQIADARSILALDPYDKEASATLKAAQAVLERSDAQPDDAVTEAWGATDTASVRKQRRVDKRERRKKRERRGSGLRAGSQSMPILPSMASEADDVGEAQVAQAYGGSPKSSGGKSRARKRELKAAKKAAAVDSAAAAAAAQQAKLAGVAAAEAAATRSPKPQRSVFASREELEAMKLSELRRHALQTAVDEDLCEAALDSDDPKAEMVTVVLAHTDAIHAKEDAAIQAWQDAEDRLEAERRVQMEMEAEAEMAAELAAEAAREAAAQERARQEAEEAERRRAEAAAVEASMKARRAEDLERLRAMKLSGLRRHGVESGLDESQLEIALDAEDPKAAIVEILIDQLDKEYARAAELQRQNSRVEKESGTGGKAIGAQRSGGKGDRRRKQKQQAPKQNQATAGRARSYSPESSMGSPVQDCSHGDPDEPDQTEKEHQPRRRQPSMQPQAARVKTALSPRVLEARQEKRREREREKELARRKAAATGSGRGAGGAIPFNPPHRLPTRTMPEEDEKQEREDVGGRENASDISAARATAKAGAGVTMTGQAAKGDSTAAMRKKRMAEVQARLQAEEVNRQSRYRKDKQQGTSSPVVKQRGHGRAVSFGNVEQATSSSSDEGAQDEDENEGGGGGSDQRRPFVEIKPRPKRNAVEEVRRYMQERGPVQSSSRTMYDEILREARALEKMLNDDDVVIC